MDNETFQKKQKEWVRKYNLRIGDQIKILRAFGDIENGNTCGWVIEMGSHVGKIEELESIENSYTIRLKDYFAWPYFVLRPMKQIVGRKCFGDTNDKT